MTSTAELIKKEYEALQKAKSAYRSRIQKLEESEHKRVLKFMKKAAFFETDFSDSELQEGFEKMIEWKRKSDQQNSPMSPGAISALSLGSQADSNQVLNQDSGIVA